MGAASVGAALIKCSLNVIIAVSGFLFALGAQSQVNFAHTEFRALSVLPGLELLQGAGGNVGVVHSNSGLLLIDNDHLQMRDKLEVALAEQGFELGVDTANFIINTHWHGEQTGNNGSLGARGAVIVAHENARKRLQTGGYIAALDQTFAPTPEEALPVLTYEQSMIVHWGRYRLQLHHPGSAHTDGDSVVYFYSGEAGDAPDAVHTGDLFANGSYPFIDASSGGTALGLVSAVADILSKIGPETKIIPGRGELATRNDLQSYHDFLATSIDRIAQLKAEGVSPPAVVAARPLREFEARWGWGRLATDTWINIVYDSL